MIVYANKIKERSKAIQSDMKTSIQGNKVKEMKPGLRSTIWNRRKK